ncbi:hypothetical protein [Psychrosphaera algicola]|uniref:Uncharacterized protein n=1 Tax=Psychrosphaera algicola TaxID=3023714 RepID=A0ABT5FFZ9_9GAMM|nr:hypothetical protein [Psychrosphaera sp. G1-22]MDC2889984.1 hypothetical protein [Psychrosphaera sp. G1-22]
MDSLRFAAKGSGIKVIGVATHGALQVKFNSICFSIETDQWRDLVWVPTPVHAQQIKPNKYLIIASKSLV